MLKASADGEGDDDGEGMMMGSGCLYADRKNLPAVIGITLLTFYKLCFAFIHCLYTCIYLPDSLDLDPLPPINFVLIKLLWIIWFPKLRLLWGLGGVVGLTLPMARADRGSRPVYYLPCSDLGQVVNLSLSVA